MLNYTDILSDKEILNIAEKTGLGKKYIVKEAVLMKALSYLEPLNKKMVLKGGTAINKIYLDEPRFSEDLDYDIIDKTVIDKTIDLLKDKFRVENWNMRRIVRLDCFYKSISNETDRIAIDFRFVKKFENTEFKITKSLLFKAESSAVQTYSLNEICKQKISALLDRKDGKDLYDCYFLIQLDNTKEVFVEYRDKILQNLKKFDDWQTYSAVSHYLMKDKRVDLKTLLENFESLLKTLK